MNIEVYKEANLIQLREVFDKECNFLSFDKIVYICGESGFLFVGFWHGFTRQEIRLVCKQLKHYNRWIEELIDIQNKINSKIMNKHPIKLFTVNNIIKALPYIFNIIFCALFAIIIVMTYPMPWNLEPQFGASFVSFTIGISIIASSLYFTVDILARLFDSLYKNIKYKLK